MDPEKGDVTRLLNEMARGNPRAADKLLPLMYSELHRLAASYMRRERPDHTLQATALINEAYLRLARENAEWNNREHFIGMAANVMRHVLVDYARAHKAQQRDGGMKRVEMQEDLAISANKLEEVVSLDEALQRLERLHPRQGKVVELRYFGGLSVEQIALLLGVSERSVKRDWSLARIWLFRELEQVSDSSRDNQK
jgi:RNA polymerase sigma-70 factor (ECF subfamily)